MDRISKTSRIPSPKDAARLGREVLSSALKQSKEFRLLFAKCLVRRSPFFPPSAPKVADSELITAIRMADQVFSYWKFNAPSEEKSKRWQELEWKLLELVKFQNLARIKSLRDRDALRTIRVIKLLAEWQTFDASAVLSDMEAYRQSHFDWEKFEIPKRPPQRGRRMGEHDQRIVAAYELLKQYGGLTKEETTALVSHLLFELDIVMTPESVWKKVMRFRNAHRRLYGQSSGGLAGYWVYTLAGFLSPQLFPKIDYSEGKELTQYQIRLVGGAISRGCLGMHSAGSAVVGR